MEFQILGRLEVLASGRSVMVAAPKQRALLALLLIHANDVLSTDRILDELWGAEPPSSGASTLRYHLSKLRQALGAAEPGAQLIVTRAPGYTLEVDPGWIDSHRFERNVRQARELLKEQPEAAADLLRDGLRMWRGGALAEFAFEEFAQVEIRRLDTLRLEARECLFESQLILQRHGDILADLETLAAEHPLRERLQGHLMIALYRLGRQADALRVFGSLRAHLVEELGLEPGPALQDLELRILTQDESLLHDEHLDFGPDRRSTRMRSLEGSGSIAYLIVDGRVVPLTRAVTTVGRSSRSRVVVQDEEASRSHAEVRRIDESFVLIDLGSLNGTEVNGNEIAEHKLQDGDVIAIGSTELTFRTSDPVDG